MDYDEENNDKFSEDYGECANENYYDDNNNIEEDKELEMNDCENDNTYYYESYNHYNENDYFIEMGIYEEKIKKSKTNKGNDGVRLSNKINHNNVLDLKKDEKNTNIDINFKNNKL
jgi:hypothetical protein